jgi:membrane-associated phospholipid phosphatase
MSRHAPFRLPPTDADLAVAKACARAATPGLERTLQVLTWLADEKVVLAGALLFWAYARTQKPGSYAAHGADQLLCSVALAGALPHLVKHLFRRRRPDRTIAHDPGRGIPRSGNAWDSFPSGHALHLGAVAGTMLRFAPRRFRGAVWPVLASLAATRVMLLAHYPSDVAAGLAFGSMVDKAAGRLVGPPESTSRRTQQGHADPTQRSS